MSVHMYLYLYKQYFNWWRWHRRKSENCFSSLSSWTYVCMSLHYFLLLFTEEDDDVETRNKRKRTADCCMCARVCVCVCMCLWPIRYSIYICT